MFSFSVRKDGMIRTREMTEGLLVTAFNATMNTCLFNVAFNSSLSFIKKERTETRKQKSN